MECQWKIFCLIFGIIGILNGVLCLTEDEINKIVEKKMEKVIEKYDRKIALLEEKIHAQDVKIQILEKKCSTPALSAEKDSAPLKHVTSDHGNYSDTQRKTDVSSTHDNRIRIVQGDPGLVAFCAYLTAEISPSLQHTLVFNSVKTNLGSAYNNNSGMFTAPADGMYVFTWTIFSGYYSYVFTQIVVNSDVFDYMITDSEHVSDIHSGTKVIVVSLNRGDLVYVRTHPIDLSHGYINCNNVTGQPSFCGWKL